MLNLLRAFKPLAVDFLSTIVFIAVYALSGNIRLGITAGIVIGVGQIATIFWRGKRPDLMQWASLALVVVLGSASLITNDPRFAMVKPSIGGLAIACVMLKPNWQGRYLPPIVTENLSAKVLIAWGYIWSALIFALAFANLFVALTLGPKIWAWYTSIVPIAAQLALFLIQYATIRHTVRSKIRAPRRRAGRIDRGTHRRPPRRRVENEGRRARLLASHRRRNEAMPWRFP